MTIATTLRTPVVWLGMAGTAMVAWGGTHNEFSFATDGWPNPVVNALGSLVPIPVNRILIVVGAILLTWAWWHVTCAKSGPTAGCRSRAAARCASRRRRRCACSLDQDTMVPLTSPRARSVTVSPSCKKLRDSPPGKVIGDLPLLDSSISDA